ncbi:MAG: ABC transporter permease, partial [Chitinophagaceae bacterium]|nr:ABC transporter permease [Chitinophagaceae bacterium]
ATKGILTIQSIILLTVPLVSIIFSTVYFYNSSEFVELLLSQPVQRKKIWVSLFTGLSLSLVVAFLLAAGIPLFLYAPYELSFLMIGIGCLITVIFVSLAGLCAMLTRDKAKGIGIAILIWLFFALLFDGLLYLILLQFSDYPIEKPMIIMASFSPIDLSRIMMQLHMDISAMMGYTGAIFKDFFGNTKGLLMALTLLLLWILIPFGISLRMFRRKDL